MRLAEECPYVTPCGWCSRQNKPCDRPNRSMLYSKPTEQKKNEQNSRK